MESSNEHNQQLFVIHLIFTGAAIVCPSVCLSVHLSVCPYECLSVHRLSVYSFICLFICMSVLTSSLSVCPSVCPAVRMRNVE